MEKKDVYNLGFILLITGLVVFCGCMGGEKSASPTTTESSTTETTTSPTQTTTTAKTTAPTTTIGAGDAGIYTGFMEAGAGQWVEYVMMADGKESRHTMKNIEADVIDGVRCIGFEMEMSAEETTMQMWVDSSTNELVKYAIKIKGEVMCMDAGPALENLPASGGEDGTPEDYRLDMPGMTFGIYTTPTGKSVRVAKFSSEEGEYWVSSEVPFGMVKTIDPSGETVMYLYDYGLSGATGTISKSEIENCRDMSVGMPEMPDILM